MKNGENVFAAKVTKPDAVLFAPMTRFARKLGEAENANAFSESLQKVSAANLVTPCEQKYLILSLLHSGKGDHFF